jgi:hypothetical protein
MPNYILLERIELNASAASVTFASIPQTGYTDLKVVVSARTTTNGFRDLRLSLNGSTSSFTNRYVEGNGTAASSGSAAVRYLGTLPGTNTTASTFTNSEIYFPNYTSSNFKSYSVDATGENNATTNYSSLIAGLWSSTAAITSIELAPEPTNNFDANSTFSLYGLAAVGTTPVIAPKASGGNRIDNDGTYWYHTFTSSGTFTPQTTLSCDALVVAGGGGGGANYGAGGGAGGLLAFTSQSIAATAQTITIGAGGPSAPSNTRGSAGSNSVLGSLTAAVGGGGGGGNTAGQYNGGNGGSGGGGGGLGGSNATGGTGTSGQGNAGANQTGAGASSGGGGAGAAGSGVNAGIGATSSLINAMGAATGTGEFSSPNYYFAGGGLGYSAGTRALGGGAPIAGSGTVNTGGGGGGDGYSVSKGGGSGIVIIRYTIA